MSDVGGTGGPTRRVRGPLGSRKGRTWILSFAPLQTGSCSGRVPGPVLLLDGRSTLPVHVPGYRSLV